MQAAANDHAGIVRVTESSPQCGTLSGFIRVGGQVVFHIAGNDDSLGLHTEPAEPGRMLRSLRRDQGHTAERARNDAGPAMQPERPIRQPGVDDGNGHTPAPRSQQVIRPEVRLDDDDEPRIELIEQTPLHERKVQRKSKYEVIRVGSLRRVHSRDRMTADSQLRAVLLEQPNQGLEQADFAHRRPVQPDHPGSWRQETEPDREIPPASAPERPISQPR